MKGSVFLGVLVVSSISLELVLGDVVLESVRHTDWGQWGVFQNCSLAGSHIVAFQLKTEPYLGGVEDDTASNGIRVFCSDPSNPGEYAEDFTSSVGDYGNWGSMFSCQFGQGSMIGFQLRVEEDQGDFGDDTATNNLRIRCSNQEHPVDFLEGDGLDFGEWREVNSCPANHTLCGLQTQVEPYQGVISDDTALNNIRMKCCHNLK